jgi:hypothetical protein
MKTTVLEAVRAARRDEHPLDHSFAILARTAPVRASMEPRTLRREHAVEHAPVENCGGGRRGRGLSDRLVLEIALPEHVQRHRT